MGRSGAYAYPATSSDRFAPSSSTTRPHTTQYTMASLLRQPLFALARAHTPARASTSALSAPLLRPHFQPARPSHTRLASSNAPLQRSTEVKDEQIPYATITLVDPATGSLMAPASLHSLLSQLDRTRYSLILADASHSPPICRILDKKAVYAKAQAKKGKAKDKAAGEGSVASGPAKEVQLSWSTSPHDLAHKLGKARELLEKRGKVNVVLVGKKGQPAVQGDVKAQIQRSVESALEEVGKLSKPATVNGGQTILEFVRA